MNRKRYWEKDLYLKIEIEKMCCNPFNLNWRLSLNLGVKEIGLVLIKIIKKSFKCGRT